VLTDLAGPAAVTAGVFSWATVAANAVLGIATMPRPAVLAAGLAWALLGVLAVTRRHPPGVVGSVVVASSPTVAALAAMAQTSAVPLSSVALVQSASYLGALLAVRGRVRAAVLAAVTQAAVLVVWGVATGRVAQVPRVFVMPALALVVAIAWWRMLGRDAVVVERETHTQASMQVQRDAAQLASARAAGRLAEIADLAGPQLRRLAHGDPVTQGGRVELVAVEAAVRDLVRARRLVAEPLSEACARARRRAVRVVLLDDGDPDGPPLPPDVLDRMAGWVDGAAVGVVTIRVLPPGREALATVLVEDGAGASRHEVGVPAL
jgi:hypothetical protein